MNDQLSSVEAYKAMIKFLEIYYKNTSSDDVAVLLGGMQLFSDGGTYDPAAWEDWLQCVEQVAKEN